jgi:hypothetical protein
MGWKSSLIIIENKEGFADENEILKAIGKSDYKFNQETTLDDCIYPNDKSINIGHYNGNIIISDDYQIKQFRKSRQIRFNKRGKKTR